MLDNHPPQYPSSDSPSFIYDSRIIRTIHDFWAFSKDYHFDITCQIPAIPLHCVT